MSDLNFALIGCGAVAKHHIKAMKLVDGGKFIGVFGAVREQTEAFATEHGLHIYETLEELFCDKKIDVVCICTPSSSHAELAIRAMENGKHVVVEKPMALTIEDCKAVIDAEQRFGRKCEVISQLRFSDTVHEVKKAIDGGYLGKIVNTGLYMKYYRSEEYYAASDWRGTWKHDGGGALMNQGIHGIDLMRYFMGSPVKISAVAKTLAHNIETEDTAAAILEYPNGAIGVVEGTTSVYPGYSRRFEICGTKGSIILEDDRVIKWDTDAPRSNTEYEKRDFGASNPDAISAKGHAAQFTDIIEAIRDGREVANGVQSGAATVAVILGIYEAAKAKKQIDVNIKF